MYSSRFVYIVTNGPLVRTQGYYLKTMKEAVEVGSKLASKEKSRMTIKVVRDDVFRQVPASKMMCVKYMGGLYIFANTETAREYLSDEELQRSIVAWHWFRPATITEHVLNPNMMPSVGETRVALDTQFVTRVL